MKLFITGINGFIGQALTARLSETSHIISGSVRPGSSYDGFPMKDITHKKLLIDEDWTQSLNGLDVVIHTAARAHIINEVVSNPLKEFQKINVASTLNLAQQAADAGVARFIFISSIGVNGNCNTVPFVELDEPMPKEPYAISKYQAEKGLLDISRNTGMEITIIRPPLVYGPGVKANFKSMIQWMNKGVPLPLGAINNKRSFVALDNLVDFIILCTEHHQAANEIFLISDGEQVSTTELLKKVAKALGKKSLLVPVPIKIMILVAKLIGQSVMSDRLFESLQIDSSKARTLLGWKPVISMDEQLKKTVDAYLNEKII